MVEVPFSHAPCVDAAEILDMRGKRCRREAVAFQLRAQRSDVGPGDARDADCLLGCVRGAAWENGARSAGQNAGRGDEMGNAPAKQGRGR
jgi:hypothetical protein